jgi:hypothetical protein
METNQYFAPAPRALMTIAGIIIMFFAMISLAVFAVGMIDVIRRHSAPTPVVVALLVMGTIGAALSVLGLRLLTGKGRRDGGLFGPGALRVGGVLFLAAPVFPLLSGSYPTAVWFAVALIPAGVACFVLAKRRRRTAM